MNELVFEVSQESDGGFVAEALGESIITQADTWDELRENVREAVKALYFDRPAPPRLRLHLVREKDGRWGVQAYEHDDPQRMIMQPPGERK